MDKAVYTMEYYSAIKRKESVSFVETWMHLETVIQSEVSQRVKQIQYISVYMWNRENVQMNRFAEQKLRHRSREKNVWTPRGESGGGGGGGGGGMNWEVGIDIYTLICIKQMTNKNLLYKRKEKKRKENSKK